MAVISIVVATRSIKNKKQILKNIKGIKGAELILVEGKNPSLQRNEGVKKAKGSVIYFLDDDSVANKASVKKALGILFTKIS